MTTAHRPGYLSSNQEKKKMFYVFIYPFQLSLLWVLPQYQEFPRRNRIQELGGTVSLVLGTIQNLNSVHCISFKFPLLRHSYRTSSLGLSALFIFGSEDSPTQQLFQYSRTTAKLLKFFCTLNTEFLHHVMQITFMSPFPILMVLLWAASNT